MRKFLLPIILLFCLYPVLFAQQQVGWMYFTPISTPSGLQNGYFWYDSGLGGFYGRAGGATINFSAGGFPITLGSTSIAAGSTTTSVTGLNTSGTAANLSGTPALPNGTTATTQTIGDNSTQLATTAFVIANAGGGGGTPGGSANSVQYNNAGSFGGIGPVNNAVVVTNGSGVPSESTTLPSGLTVPSPSITGIPTLTGAQIQTPVTATSHVIDVTKIINTDTTSGNTTLTKSGTPTANSVYTYLDTDTSGSASTITLPDSAISVSRGGAITNFQLPANGTVYLKWIFTGGTYYIFGDPVSTSGSGSYALTNGATLSSPNIAALANLTTNGIVTTSGGVGTLTPLTNAASVNSTLMGLLGTGWSNSASLFLTAAGTWASASGSTGISGATANGAMYATAATTGTSTAALTNGQVLIGSTGTTPVASTLTGTANQITVTNGAGSATFSIPSSAILPGSPTVATPGTASGSIATIDGTQTLTNKSIAGSEINSGTVANTRGGTGQDTSGSTGVAQVSGGTWSVSTALANGTTATTQSAFSNDTKTATDAYADRAGLASITGSAASPSSAGGSLTLTAPVTIIYITSASTASTWTLPTASSNTGRAVLFTVVTGGAHHVNVYGGAVVLYLGATALTSGHYIQDASPTALDYIVAISDGTNWSCQLGTGYAGTWADASSP